MDLNDKMFMVPLSAYLNKRTFFPDDDVEIKVHLPENQFDGFIENPNFTENYIQNGDFTDGSNNWKKNQDVSLNAQNGRMIVTSNKIGSTPGILYETNFEVGTVTEVYFSFSGSKSRNNLRVCPFVRGLKTTDSSFKKTIVWGYAQYLQNILNYDDIKDIHFSETEKETIVIFKLPSDIDKLQVGFLFTGQEIGDQFMIDNVSVTTLNGESIFNPNNIIINSEFDMDSLFWGKNGNFTCDIIKDRDNNELLISNPTSGATPGIKHEKIISVIPGGNYILSYRGYIENLSYSACPLISGYTNNIKVNTIIWAENKYLVNVNNVTNINELSLTTENKEFNIGFSIPENINGVKIHMLYNSTLIPVSWIRLDYIRLFSGNTSNINSEKTVNICVFDKEKQLMDKFLHIDAKQQTYVKNAFALGCNWDTKYVFKIPSDYKPDIYFIEVIDKFCNVFSMYFIVKNPICDTDILVLSNNNTHEAYNDWAGLDGYASYYKWLIEDDTYKYSSNYISNQRPDNNTSIHIRKYDPNFIGPVLSNLIAGELYLYNWLTNNGIKYDIINDLDLNSDNNILRNYKILIIHTHPEYWTKNMMVGLNKFRNNGGKIMYLGGNGLYWKVTYDENTKIMENRKDNSIHSQDGLFGGLWKIIGNQLLPHDTTNDLIGSDYFHLVDVNNEPFGAPYRILQPNDWVFSNITDTLVGLNSLNAPKSNYEEGTSGASGHEMDRDIQGTHTQYIIAEGDNPDNNGAHMLYFEKNGGKIFSTGSISYTGSLLVDENISKITKNVINYMLLQDKFFEKYNSEEIKEIIKTLQ
jgi:hypothetical protein